MGKTVNVAHLRKKLGLVMQEPILFNYTLTENILYGKLDASNEEVQNAAQIANAREFVESKELSQAFSDEPASLKIQMQSAEYKDKLISELKQEKFDEYFEKMDKLAKKA